MELVIIVGPQQCGKTCNSERLKAHYQCDQVIDELHPKSRLPESGRILALTNDDRAAASFPGAKVIPFSQAIKAVTR